nr:venom carboxylesterase-6-like [Leptinotarsa decemlineata]
MNLISVVRFFIQMTLVAVIHGIAFLAKNKYNSTLQVSTKNGVVQGKQVYSDHGSSYIGYYGIPYAAPPVKSLRFKAPQPVQRWTGVLDVTKMQSGCVETQLRFIGDLFQTHGTEDCLYINVYTPIRKDSGPIIALDEPGTQAGVTLFWVFRSLSALRQLSTSFLSTEDEASYGNYGLKDQFAALEWVNLNIENFGGDSKKVTMAGHSSGSASALYQMIYPKSWGLYCGVIGLSGEMSGELSTQKYPRRTAFDIGSYLGIRTNNSTELIERLREVELDNLKKAQNRAFLAALPNILEDGLPFTPIIEKNHEHAFLTKNKMDILKSGSFAKVPLLTGMTSNEIAFLGEAIPFLRFLFLLYEWSPSIFPNQLNVTTESGKRIFAHEVRKKYFKYNSFVKATSDEVAQLLSDLLFVRPITNSAKTMSSFIPVYFYVFEYSRRHVKELLKSVGYPLDIYLDGAAHIEDLAYIWKSHYLELTAQDDEMRKRMTKIWSNFARYGNPTPTVDPLLQNITWPQLPKTEDIPYLRIDVNLSIRKNYRSEFVNFLNELARN